LLSPGECAGVARLYGHEPSFRTRIVMERHAFGRGEYKYFGYPLPPQVEALREALYFRLAPIANRWAERLRLDTRYPPGLDAFLRTCHEAGQTRPTPLLLRYDAEGYNCLHQDLYGSIAFPLQATVLLSRPGEDFAGGEFLLVEQRPRAQSRGEVVPLEQGQAVLFANSERPVPGARGFYRVKLRHGVSRVTSGHRMTLGLIFHDSR
ncbi:MAG TPA: 2OG-Fe(II) oxygenase, partial [Sphingomonas sp.]|nr:2OG-Fe(II) oxygenase [Sphingomonas sp.]